MKKEIKNKVMIAAMVFGLIALGNAGSTLYLSALIDIGEKIAADGSQMQLTLSCYLISFGISQIFYGPLSDAFGRKLILTVGIIIFLVGTLISALSTSIEMLMFGRLIEGLGIGSVNTVGYAIIRDIYQGNALSKVMSYASVFVGMTPIIAPCIGGLLAEMISWQACFYFLLLVALFLFFLVKTKLVETNSNINPRFFSLKVIMANYHQLLCSRTYIGNVLVTSFAFAGLISINNMMPFLITKQFDLTPSFYGLMTIFTGCGYFSGAFISGILSVRIGRMRTIYYGCIVQFIVVFFSLLHGYEDLSLAAIILTFAIYLHGVGLIVPTGTGGSMELFPKIAGSEAALLGVFMYSFSAIFSAVCSHIPKTSEKYTVALLAFLSIATVCSTLMIQNKKTN